LESRRYAISKFQLVSHHCAAIALLSHIFTIAAAFFLPFIPAASASHGYSVFLVLPFLCPDFQVYFFILLRIKWLARGIFFCGYLCNYFPRKSYLCDIL